MTEQQNVAQSAEDVGYARAADVLGLEREVQELVRFGVPVDRVHTDIGHSGDKSRPGLDAALDALTPGDRLVITSPHRLARDASQWEAVKLRLDAAGATLTGPGVGDGVLVDTMMYLATGTAAAESAAMARRRASRLRGDTTGDTPSQ